jgi:hypothetical protein
MKIAVLLRGKAHNGTHGAKLFKRLITDRYPQYEFKFFMHTWTSSIDFESPYPRALSIQDMPRQDLDSVIGEWNPVAHEVESDALLLETVIDVLWHNAQDIHFVNYWHDVISKHARTKPIYDYFIAPKELKNKILKGGSKETIFAGADNNNYQTLRAAILIHYLVAQLYSASRVANIYKEYAKSSDWNADLIWCTRPDTITWLRHPNSINRLYAQLSTLFDEQTISYNNHILCNEQRIYKGTPWVQDYNFFLLPQTINSMFTNSPSKSIFDLLTAYKYECLGIPSATNSISHLLWSLYGRDCTFVTANEKIVPKILRPFNPSYLDISDDKECFDTYTKYIINTPRHTEEPIPTPRELLVDTFNYLRGGSK